MVSLPIPDDIPAPDQATVDIRGAFDKMKDPVCGWGRYPSFVITFAKPTNTALPLYVPVSGATLEGRVNLISTKTGYTDANGIGYACLFLIGTNWVDFRVRKNDVDFGEGKGAWSDWKGYSPLLALDPKIITFSGNIDIPCPIMRNISITAVSGFDDLISKPHIVATLYPPSFPGYGSISTAGSPFEIYLNDTKLGSGTISSAGDIDFTAPSELQDISSITQWGQSVTLKIIANIAGCEFQGTRTITLPTIPEIPELPEICEIWETVASPSVPGILRTPFPISVSGAKWVCEETGEGVPITGTGKIIIGGHTFDLPITNGYGRVYLENFVSIPDLITELTGGAPAVTAHVTTIPPETSPKVPGTTTATLYLNDYLRRGIYTPIRGAYWGAGIFSKSGGYYTIHKAEDASGKGDEHGVMCKLNVSKTHEDFGEYRVSVLSVQNLGLENASYTVKIKL